MKVCIYIRTCNVFFILFLLLHTSAFALGTLKNTVIVASANSFVINFKNYTGVDQNPVSPQNHLYTGPVLGIYGFNFYNAATANLYAPTDINRSIGAGVSANFLQNIVNISNDPANISVRVTGAAVVIAGNVGTLSQWKFGVVNPTLNLLVNTVSNNWLPQIKPAGDALKASQVGTSLNVLIPGWTTDNTQYVGFNNNLYGGYNQFEYFISATILGPTLRLANRFSQIDSSMNNYSGNANDLVPGAKINYSIVIVNDGNAPASTINITERIPANTTFFAIGSGDHNSVQYIDGSNGIHNSFDLSSANVKAIIFKKDTLNGSGTAATFNYSVTVN